MGKEEAKQNLIHGTISIQIEIKNLFGKDGSLRKIDLIEWIFEKI